MKKLLVAALVAACPIAANAGVLLGAATLNSTNDLTRVQAGSVTYEFLDLTSTQGQSQTAALAAYGASGFAVATSTEMSALYSAFGFTYAAPNGYTPLTDADPTESLNFVDYFGFTYFEPGYGGAALGSFIDDAFGQAYNCIGYDVCATNGFTYNDDVSSGDQLLGVYMVRQAAAVPEPAVPGLFAMGLAALATRRRRKRALNTSRS